MTGKMNVDINLKNAIKCAIIKNATEYLNPPITNIGYKGILKTSREIIKWFKNSKNIARDFKTTAMLMEKAGTGGGLFRKIYCDFLLESAEKLDSELLIKAGQKFEIIAQRWSEVAYLFDKAGGSEDIIHVNSAAKILADLSIMEKTVMQQLLENL